MKTFSVHDRQENLKKLQSPEDQIDILIIGGGITGAGVARDAAMRGMKVALVEANDFAYGTSSRSSKLIHGGIRYLENLEFNLVFEALSERQKLFEMAPHLVHPLRFTIPLYEGGRVGMLKMSLGMWLYDTLSLFQTPEMHERFNVQQTINRMPMLKKDHLLGSFEYSDAYMDDDRLVHETLRSANEFGAIIVNHTKALDAQFDGNRVTAIECEDLIDKKKFWINPKHVIASTGPWTDLVGSKLFPKWKNLLRPTKGVHLTFSKDKFCLPNAVVMAAEGRIVFAIPRHDMVIVGTTDTDFKESPDKVIATSEDITYLLSVVHNYFPGFQIKESDAIASYAGIRPLVHDGAASEGKTSREHLILTQGENVTFVTGGKYTTYRLMAEQVVNEVLKHFPLEMKIKYKRSNTMEPLNPYATIDAKQLEYYLLEDLRLSTELSTTQRQWLVDRHSLEAKEIVRRFGLKRTYWEYEALHSLENTMCLRLADFYLRRSPLFLAYKDHGLGILPIVSKIFQEYLGWTDDQRKSEELFLHKYIFDSCFSNL